MDNICFLWREAVLNKYGSLCYIEDCTDSYSDIHHFFTKGAHPTLKYEVRNGVPLCKKHHDLIHDHKRQDLDKHIIKKRGKKWLANLQSISNKSKTLSEEEIIKNIKKYI